MVSRTIFWVFSWDMSEKEGFQRQGKESSENLHVNYKVVQTFLGYNLQCRAYIKSIKQLLLEWSSVQYTVPALTLALDIPGQDFGNPLFHYSLDLHQCCVVDVVGVHCAMCIMQFTLYIHYTLYTIYIPPEVIFKLPTCDD